VRGDRAENLVRASGSGSHISETQLKRAQPTSSGEMLRRVPGLVVRQEDASGLRLNLGVRGLSPTRSRLVLVEEDGVPLVVSPYGEPELYYSTPVERIQRIDVAKGTDILLHGPQTVGGVVQFHSWEAPTREEWSVEGEAGQRAFAKALARYGNSAGDVRYVVQVMRKQGDGFRDMGFKVTDFMGKVVFPTSKTGEATLKLVAYDEASNTTYVGLTQPLYLQNQRANTVAPNDTFNVRRYEASLSHLERIGGNTELRTSLFAYTMQLGFRQQDFDRTFDPTATYDRVLGPEGVSGAALYFKPTNALRDRVYDVTGVQLSLTQNFNTGDVVHKLLVGTRALYESARRKQGIGATPTSDVATPTTDDTTDILGFSLFAQDRIAFLDGLLVLPAFRFEHSNSTRTTRRMILPNGTSADVNAQGSSSASGLSPGVEMIVGRPDANLFGGMHLGYSPPRISQAITPGGADAGLDAERSVNYETGARARPAKWARIEATGFLTNFDNQLISNNTLSGSAAEFKNGGKTRHLGIETTLGVALGKALHIDATAIDLAAHYTLARSTFTGGLYSGNVVPYAPLHTFSATLDGEHRTGIGAQASFTYIASQYADEFNSEEPDISGRAGKVPGYGVLDLGARYHHKPTGLTANLLVKNALDDVYISSRLPNGIFTAGFRQITVGLKWAGP